ncbi:MAG TPA: apolipoprotein N-acyltransferase [Candidatus Binatia bacterium]|jgi:apolipoprotein N-acyltransferase
MPARLLDAALVVAGAALYAAAFPPYGCDVTAWVALVPLLAVLDRVGQRGALVAGAAYGSLFFAALVPWVVSAAAAYFGARLLTAVAFAAAICVLFVAGYGGLFALAARRLLRRGPWTAFVGIPALWVAYELARATLLTGLPWELLGHSQWRRLALIQIADAGGVYALSFVIAALNVGLYLAVRALRERGSRELLGASAPLAVACGLVALVAAYGSWRLREATAAPPPDGRTIALAQGNVPESWRWSRQNAERNLLTYVGLSRGALAHGAPDLIVWPEYALTLYPERDATVMPALRDLAARTTGGVVFGAPRVRDDAAGTRYFNSAYHIAPSGNVTFYDKIHLVPFAEYDPLPFDESLAADSDSAFSAGGASTVIGTPVGRLGMLICYEVIFPELSRQLTRGGAEILLNLSNDGWVDHAGLGAGVQHLSISVFRAVENRRYVARAAASGISGFIDPWGRPFGELAAGRSGLAVGRVVPRRDLTLYTRMGDVFAFACVAVGLALLLASRQERA